MADPKSKGRSTVTIVLFAIYLLLLAWLVLFKLQFSVAVLAEGRVFNWIPLRGSFGENGAFRFSEIRNNIIVFLPLGVYLCMLVSNWTFAKKLLAIASVTLVFEAAQFLFAIGRADITDVLSNVLGGIFGIGIYALASKWLKGRTDLVMNVLGAVCTIAMLALAATLILSDRWIIII